MSLLLSLVLSSVVHAAPLPVKIQFLEALNPKDTTSSERFQREYEIAISTAKSLVSKRLKECGYQLEDKAVFYSATDSVEALERAKVAEKESAWMLVGPRRSNHYILMTQGAPSTPSVSNMASSDEVSKLGALHLSVAPSNERMAKVAAIEIKSRLKKVKQKSYVSIVSEDCVSCVDFGAQFDIHAKKTGLKRLAEVRIAGENPDLTEAVKVAVNEKPAFVLLPNYSKPSALAIAAIHKALPETLFVGGDGWGDSRFGYVQNANELEGTSGITVRGFPPADEALKEFDLGRRLLESQDPSLKKPGSGSALAILKIIEGATDLLCKHKPKSASQFKRIFERHGKNLFRSPWGVSIYELRSGDITFKGTVGLK